MSRLNAIVRRLDNRMNPIVVKELRQTSRGKFLIVILLGFLFIQLTVTGVVSFFATTGSAPGPQLFQALLGFLTGTCALLIPAYAGFRLANERADANVDLLFSTTLKPHSIIWGKTLSAGILTCMIYSACMPFIIMTYMLRGIDLQLTIQLLAISFIFVLVATQIGILIGSMPGNRVIKGIVGLFALFSIFGCLMIGIVAVFVAGTFGGIDFLSFLTTYEGMWATVGIIAGGLLASAGLFLMSAAFVSPPSSNRALAPRIYATALWGLSFAAILICSEIYSSSDPIAWWMLVFNGIFGTALMISVCERDELGVRVRRKIPRSGAARAFAFLFYSGSAGGFIWSSIGIVLTLLIGSYSATSVSASMISSDLEAILYPITFTACGSWIGALGAVLIHRKLLKNRISSVYTWLIAYGIQTIGGLLWAVFLIGANMGGFGGMASGSASSAESFPSAAAGLIALILCLICLPWMARQIAAFKPYFRSTNAS